MDALQSIVAAGSVVAGGTGSSLTEQAGDANGSSLFGEMFAQATAAVDKSKQSSEVPGDASVHQTGAAAATAGSIVSMIQTEDAVTPEDRMIIRNLLAREIADPSKENAAVMQKRESGLLLREFRYLKHGTEKSGEEVAGLDSEAGEVVGELQEHDSNENHERTVPAELLGGLLAPLMGSQQGVESKAVPVSEVALVTVAATTGLGDRPGKASSSVPIENAEAVIQGIVTERQDAAALFATPATVGKSIAEGENQSTVQLKSQNSLESNDSEGDERMSEAEGATDNQGRFGITMGKSKHSDITLKTSDSEMVGMQRQDDVEAKAEVSGDAVLRRLPSGVTVVNPAQTVLRGQGQLSIDGLEVVAQGTPYGRVAGTEGENQAEHGVKNASRMEASESILNSEAAPSDQNMAWNHEPGAGTNSQGLSGSQPLTGYAETGKIAGSESVPFQQVDVDKAQFQENILSQVKDRLASQELSAGNSRITLKLNPGELGELQIQVRLQDQRLHVDIAAQNHAVKEVLLQNIDQLKEALSRQNIAMERFDVSTGNGQWQGSSHSFNEGHQASRQQFDGYAFAPAAFFGEESMESRIAYVDSRESSLVDMRY